MKRSNRRRLHLLTPREMSDEADRARTRRRQAARQRSAPPPPTHTTYPLTDVMDTSYVLMNVPSTMFLN